LAAVRLVLARDGLIVANLGIRQIYGFSVNADIIISASRADGDFSFYRAIGLGDADRRRQSPQSCRRSGATRGHSASAEVDESRSGRG
jgi:hypothetical protein